MLLNIVIWLAFVSAAFCLLLPYNGTLAKTQISFHGMLSGIAEIPSSYRSAITDAGSDPGPVFVWLFVFGLVLTAALVAQMVIVSMASFFKRFSATAMNGPMGTAGEQWPLGLAGEHERFSVGETYTKHQCARSTDGSPEDGVGSALAAFHRKHFADAKLSLRRMQHKSAPAPGGPPP